MHGCFKDVVAYTDYMIHCGDPIQYARIDTSYWQSHFLAFGRLPNP